MIRTFQFLLPVLASLAAAGEAVADSSDFRRFNALPVAGYTTETGVEAGLLGIVYFRPSGTDTVGPELDLAAVASQRRQMGLVAAPILSLGGWGIRSSWKLFDWPGRYWEGGNHPGSSHLAYDMRTWSGSGELQVPVGPSRLHPLLAFDLEGNRTRLHPDSSVRGPTRLGGERIGGGAGLVWDSRDQENWPRSGTYLRCLHQRYGRIAGGDWTFSDTRIDARTFLPAVRGGTWALASYWEGVQGNAPFDRLPAPDGSNRMRGLDKGRLRDRQEWVLQAEGRFPIGRSFACVGFVDAAKVGSDPDFLWKEEFHESAGIGVRYALNRERGINLRMDLAWVDGGSAAAISFKEAF